MSGPRWIGRAHGLLRETGRLATAVHHPLAVARAAEWRSALAMAALILAAACDGDSPTAPDLAARTGQDLPPDELAGLVAEHLVSSDFAEPADDRLLMEVRGDLLFARGVVNGNSQREAIELLNGSPGVRTLVLTWVPGSVDDEVNLALGRTLSDAGMTTYLPRGGMVASGGTDLLVAGARRIVECGALVGVHSWASGSVSGNDIPRDDPRHSLYLDYYRDIGIAEAFYWFTLEAAPPDSVHWMTEDEMERYAVHTHFRGPCGQLSSRQTIVWDRRAPFVVAAGPRARGPAGMRGASQRRGVGASAHRG